MSSRDSSAFGLLDREVQRWIWREGWEELKDIQEEAIRQILTTPNDLIISAPTATGKTEAAFLPIVSKLVRRRSQSVDVLYVSPLKALINDQWERLDRLCDDLNIPVHKWHGDVSAAAKERLTKSPSGILLITPESLEALFVRRGHDVTRVFQSLDEVVIDELHAFIGSVRGTQLQSILHRLETALSRDIRRIGLSATLSDMSIAASFLRPSQARSAALIQSTGGSAEIRLQMRGYVARPPASSEEEELSETRTEQEIAEHLFASLNGSTNLVFANRKSEVEYYTDKLRALCEAQKVPQQFWAHHGSLSRQYREEVEAMLKQKGRPTTVVCTSTLELGIDIGAVNSVGQIGCPPSVASMRQRLGRSGRRGEAAVLRVYITENEINTRSPIQDMLRVSLIQTIAMIELLRDRWYEPSDPIAFDASTMLHQVLATIAERSGITPENLWQLLCETGPFRTCSKHLFVDLLRFARERELVVQANDRTLLLGRIGERLANHYSFYTVFMTPDEYRLVNSGQLLGTIPITFPVSEGSFLIFAGSRWRAIRVSEEEKIIEVTPAAAGRPPLWNGGGARVHDQVRRQMLQLYRASGSLPYLDPKAALLLAEARHNFSILGLDHSRVLSDGRNSIVFPWAGDRTMHTMVFQLRAAGLEAGHDGVTISVANASPEVVNPAIQRLAEGPPADTLKLAASVQNKVQEKYDRYLSETVLCASYSSRNFDAHGALRTFQEIAQTVR